MTADDLTLMVVHAHPDDESSSTGGVLARYSAEGFRTVVVTCTNGELGDGPDHVKPGEDGHSPDEVARVRLGELEAACKELGVSDLELLGYHDSGMADWHYKDDQRSFCNVGLDEVSERIAGLITRYRPQVVVTYGDMGRYNHPDHVHAHRATVTAFERNPSPEKLYFIVRRRYDWEQLRETMRARGIDIPLPPQGQIAPERRGENEARAAAVESLITTTVDTTEFARRKRAALSAHASQLDRSWWTLLPDDVFVQIFSEETFVRDRDASGAPLPESDLFAGLRPG